LLCQFESCRRTAAQCRAATTPYALPSAKVSAFSPDETW
jgi:hypothetical protein